MMGKVPSSTSYPAGGAAVNRFQTISIKILEIVQKCGRKPRAASLRSASTGGPAGWESGTGRTPGGGRVGNGEIPAALDAGTGICRRCPHRTNRSPWHLGQPRSLNMLVSSSIGLCCLIQTTGRYFYVTESYSSITKCDYIFDILPPGLLGRRMPESDGGPACRVRARTEAGAEE